MNDNEILQASGLYLLDHEGEDTNCVATILDVSYRQQQEGYCETCYYTIDVATVTYEGTDGSTYVQEVEYLGLADVLGAILRLDNTKDA